MIILKKPYLHSGNEILSKFIEKKEKKTILKEYTQEHVLLIKLVNTLKFLNTIVCIQICLFRLTKPARCGGAGREP